MAKKHGVNVYDESWEKLTKDKAFESFMPTEVCISLYLCNGIICKPAVKPGEFVSRGQVIGEAEEKRFCVYASISGRIEEIFFFQKAPGIQEPFVKIIKEQGQSREWYPFSLDLNKETIKKIIDQIGVFNITNNLNNILIVNGFDNEPYITSGYRLIMESPGKIVIGAILAAIASESECIYLIVDENCFEAVIRLKKSVKKYEQVLGNRRPIWILPIKRRYPNDNKQIISQKIAGNHQPDVNVVTLAEMTALYDAVYDGEPWTKVGVTITGKVFYPKNLWVPIGTKVKDLIEYCGGIPDDSMVIYGGPLRGKTVESDNYWIQRDASGILVLDQQDIPESSCIHCGMCRDICPKYLKPDLIEKAYLECEKISEDYNVEKCIHCGLCSYVCPSGHRLTEYVGQVKKGRIRKKYNNTLEAKYIDLDKKGRIFKQLKTLEQKSQSPPHIHRRGTIRDVMRHSVIGLVPLIIGTISGDISQSLHIAAMLLVGMITSGLTEYFWQEINGRYSTVWDGSAVFSGLLLALLFSQQTSLWKILFASIFIIIFGKQCFGGIGHSPIHPVILGKLVFDPFGTAMIESLWYLAIASFVWMLLQRMIPFTFTITYFIIVAFLVPGLLTSGVFYIAIAYFVWSYETMVPTRAGKWGFTLTAAFFTILFNKIGMGNFGIYLAFAFTDLIVPWLSVRTLKRV